MDIKITSVGMQWGIDEVTREEKVTAVLIQFSGHMADRSINLNGRIPISPEQYEGNESMEALKGIVTEHIVAKLTQPK